MAREDAFVVLGIPPTSDGRTIRSAFLRLARIYHPDRFVGVPDDVREEAERRMKAATAAYEALRKRSAQPADVPPPQPRGSRKDPWEEARKYREESVARQKEAEEERTRWVLWERLEREARERAAWEAEMAKRIMEETWARPADPVIDLDPTEQAPKKSLLLERLEAARRGLPDASPGGAARAEASAASDHRYSEK